MIPKKYLPDNGAKVGIICFVIMSLGLVFKEHAMELAAISFGILFLSPLYINLRSSPEYELFRKESK